ncbi:oxygen-independent coproporphyrinogen III oxidase [Marchantia polymorpha subsp. ruderalis]|uniref:Radical S-adenosyl methionine domain-containing protein 1, mitochondrial n=2 Tax=Marchantia polymorpha TaxID=3197 RepID=A0AAF6ALC9_MARPO|nr:hypothetical protein MARPO_0005s0190 [Marchantia polymorpha]BBM97249.1 hypothetical protein Mp_1g04170 [Marchantia polymorpha subsp. ruderalis]|eukprot:PTQ48559.1 hypothetical protein MARPO_0005s0190 [Marchantia polymorpha]
MLSSLASPPSLSSHFRPRLAGLLVRSAVHRISSRACEIYGGQRRRGHEIEDLCGGISSRLAGGEIQELRRCVPSWSSRVAARHVSASASGGAGLITSPRSGSSMDIASIPEHSPSSVYIHIPFCRRRCFYCDFTIVAVGERTDQTSDHQDSVMANYVDLVCKEIASTARKRGNCNDPALETVFFGGGTPSLLPVPLLARIMNELRAHFQISETAEIAMEMDPGTFDRQKLEGFLDCGISRVSLGVQSFQDELLKSCGRAHGLQQVHDAVKTIHSTGLQNWSIDLIASLPNQTLDNWEQSLQQTIAARPAHVSVYDLQIEEGTLFNRWYKAGESPLPSDDKAAEFYRTASLRLREAGYEHYEVSNYARPGFQCRHNLVYWENRPYFAFGLGSTSYVEGRRFSRPKKMREYKSYVASLELASDSEVSSSDDYPANSVEDQILDTIMLSLRLARGLNLESFEASFGSSVTSTVCSRLIRFIDIGLVEALDGDCRLIPRDVYKKMFSEGGGEDELHSFNSSSEGLGPRVEEACTSEKPVRSVCASSENMKRFETFERKPAYVRLTDPEGFLLSNEVISSIFSALPSGEL